MNILYIGSHSILEYDEVRLLSSLGHDVFSIGAYTDPANPTDAKRPPIRGMTYHADLAALCHKQREKHAGEDLRYYIDYAKADLHPELLDWADVTIIAAFPDAWIVPQWAKLRSHRIVWRTIGQSDPTTETYLAPYRKMGLEIVRYSPRERHAFETLDCFAGEDALIRFVKDPADYGPWIADGTAQYPDGAWSEYGREEKGKRWGPFIGNITQDMAGRGEACGYSFWMEATKDLPARPAGPGSEALPGGIGALSYDELREYLRRCRAYLATGTQPASYTLNFIEALMTGTPVVAMGRERFGWPPIYEADEIAVWSTSNPAQAAIDLERLLGDENDANAVSRVGRQRALELFSVDVIAPQWAAFLGVQAKSVAA